MNLSTTQICDIYIKSKQINLSEPVYENDVQNALPNINLNEHICTTAIDISHDASEGF